MKGVILYMNTTSPRDRLVEALRNPPAPMREKLDSLKRIGKDLSNRIDLVWHMLLRSMSGMGNNRGKGGRKPITAGVYSMESAT
jgi:hypothetical protein